MDESESNATTGPSSADTLAARREARRKRILENSNNRLTKITGREHNEPPAVDFTVAPPEIIYPDPEDERDVYQQPETILLNPQTGFPSANGDIFSLLNTLSQAQANGGIPGGGTTQGTETEAPPAVETKLVKFLRTKIHLAVMAVVIYILFATERQHLVGGSVFLPMLAWQMIEMLVLKTHEPKSTFLDIVFLLGGIPKKYSQIIVKFAQTINKVLKDVAFFIFFFVMAHLVWSRLVLDITLDNDRLEASDEDAGW